MTFNLLYMRVYDLDKNLFFFQCGGDIYDNQETSKC